MQPSGWTGWEVTRKGGEGARERTKDWLWEKENNLVTGTHSIELNRIQLKKINRENKASMEHFKTCQHCFCSVWSIICHLVFAVNPFLM